LPTGRVKFFNTDPGFGFILPDDGGPDVFVHVHDVEAAGMKMLVADQLVEYELGPARDGPLKGCQSSFALTSRPSSSRMPSWRASGVVRGVRRDNLAEAFRRGLSQQSVRRNAIADDADSAVPLALDKGLPFGIGDKVGATVTNRTRSDSLAHEVG
jgi:cold shock protein